MRALSLTQPWASLVAAGFKKVETRSWSTPYRGPLAIHAAKGYPRSAQEFMEEVRHLLPTGPLPLGAVVCLVTLDSVRPTSDPSFLSISTLERRCGDYAPGRYGWTLSDPKAFAEPIPTRGRLGLWEWSVLGVPGIRDGESPCFEYRPGPRRLNARCEGDGHYLCKGCEIRVEERP